MRVIKVLLVVLIVSGCSTTTSRLSQKEAEKVADTVLKLEQQALERWCQADPSGYLEIAAPDIVYIDPDQSRKLVGLDALTGLFTGLRGKIRIDRYELLNPTVQVYRDTAVLTYNYVGYVSGQPHRWNCTQVYCKRRGKWWIVHTHWSITGPLRLGS